MKRVRNIFISIIYLIYIQLISIFHNKLKRIYCTILYYHSIPNDKIDRFKEQINILRKITTPIALDYDGANNNKSRYSIVTFDDAFKSAIANGVPELTKLKIPFSVFIPAGQLGRNPGWLKNTGHKDEYEIVSSIEELLSVPSDIVIFGSHTINHCDLIKVNYEQARIEIKGSKKILESTLKKEIKYLSFPYGSFNSKIAEYCYEVGYNQIFSIIAESPIEPLRKFIKGRVRVDPSDWKIEFILKILGAYGWKSIGTSIKMKLGFWRLWRRAFLTGIAKSAEGVNRIIKVLVRTGWRQS